MNIQNLILAEALYILVEARTGFDFRTFKQLKSPKEQEEYASGLLPKLGEGSARAVYRLNNRHVLKIAAHDRHAGDVGYAQNRAEVEIWTDPNTKKIAAQILDAADDFSWIIMELVKPIDSFSEFKSLTGVGWGPFDMFLDELAEGTTKEDLENDLNPSDDDDWDSSSHLYNMLDVFNTEFGSDVADIIQQTNMIPTDIGRIEHWGKTADGRVVVLDYGFTDETSQYY